jgi:Flp pilus assembly protein TadD
VLDAIRNICDHLVERSTTLFLGAGVNAGIQNANGTRCPLGQELSEWICKDLLLSPETKVPLNEAVEIARHKLGVKPVNDYIYENLASFVPGAAHLALVQLPWDVIYTTNFDLLVERAATQGQVNAAGAMKTVLTSTASLTSFSESDVLYYKLHGTIDLANTPDGRLILTQADYRFYEDFKRPLFGRLRTDLLSRNFLFVGYSLSDPNFRAVLEDCRQELGVQAFPLSYAIQHEFSSVQEAFWRDKYNIQLVRADATEFLVLLKDTWLAEKCEVVPFLQRKAVEYLNFDTTTRFQKVGDSFYLMRAGDCTGPSNPSAFFRGAQPTWADVRDRVPPRRDAYETLLEAIYPEIAEPAVGPSAVLVTGSAGTGKTALIRSFAFDIAEAFAVPIFVHVAGTPLDARILTPLISSEKPDRFVVLVDSAGEYAKELGFFWEEIQQKKLPITLLLEERKNQWLVSRASLASRFNPTEIELSTLSSTEIDLILDALKKYGCLDRLTGTPRDEQFDHFTALAHQDLLVALRELTTKNSFDNIVRNEFEKIPFQAAKQAYLYVSAVGQFDLAVRYETLIRVLSLRHNQLGPEILMPTEGVLVAGEETGASRHNIGFRLKTRHPVIASVIFAHAAPSDQQKFDVLNGLLSNLDPGFPEDMRLLTEITKRRDIVNVFAAHAMRRALYDRIAAILPNNGYVYQHRSIIERDMHDAEQAIHFARAALKLNPQNAGFQNTLGLALEFAAREEEGLKRSALLSEAEKLFDDSIERDRTDPYGYVGKLNLIRQKIERSTNKEERDEQTLSALALLEEAYEATAESAMIAGELGRAKKQLGSLDEALGVVRRASKKNPADIRLKQLMVEMSVERGDSEEALKIAVEAARTDPTNWRIQRSLARIRTGLGSPVEAVRGHYDAAIRYQQGDEGLVIELGAYLFINGRYDDAKVVFETIRNLPLSGQDRNRIRSVWRGDNNELRVFEGRVVRLQGAIGTVVSIPENFHAFFWRSTGTSLLRDQDQVTFNVGFNTQGALARNIRKLR